MRVVVAEPVLSKEGRTCMERVPGGNCTLLGGPFETAFSGKRFLFLPDSVLCPKFVSQLMGDSVSRLDRSLKLKGSSDVRTSLI